jgi:hypothetical protein
VRFLVFFGHEQADVAAVTEAADERGVGKVVELLDLFALDIHAAGLAHDIDEAGAVNFRGDDFRGEGDAGKQPAELRVRVRTASVEKMAFDSRDQSLVRHGAANVSRFVATRK